MNFWKIDEKEHVQNSDQVDIYFSTLNGLSF